MSKPLCIERRARVEGGLVSQAPASANAAVPGARNRSSARLAARFLVAAVIGLAVGPPLLVATLGIWQEHERAHTRVQTLAYVVQRDIARAEGPIGELAQRLQGWPAGADEASIVSARGQADVHLQGHPDLLTRPRWVAQRSVDSPWGPLQVQLVRSLANPLLAAVLCALFSVAAAMLLWRRALSQPLDALQRAEALLGALSRRDALTGLHNRNGLRVRLARALERSHATRRVGVVLIDVDRFRVINQSLGHPAGDELLCAVADRIRSVTRMDDVVARLGGDQFAVLVEDAPQAQAAQSMARNLLRAFDPPHVLNGQETVVTLSIGIALAGDTVQGVDNLLICAETAVRAAKTAGGGRSCLYEAGMQSHDEQQQLTIERQLRQALLEQQFFLVYQPIAELGDGRIVGVEALVRWNHPTRGVVAPAEFVPLLERNGLIVPAGRWVLERACRQMAAWAAAGANGITLSVNVSPRQFAEPDFVDTVLAVLAQTRVAAQHLRLEVTEGLLLDPSSQTLAKLDALAASGIKIAIDDFGMGYSSLAYLKRFRLNALKIDRMFVHDMTRQPQDAAIVRAIIDLGHG
ncbi:MAG TPA: EAL domain-containing protein, partial [Burkholderiaceae bacterium]|nr:EAL domain-containing protein [Burkholderiaceae bacterium]